MDFACGPFRMIKDIARLFELTWLSLDEAYLKSCFYGLIIMRKKRPIS
jgi:hypothetical protein